MAAANASRITPHDRLICKLESITDLTAREADVLRALPLSMKVVEESADVVSEGDRPTACCLLVEGVLFRYKMLGDGRRQIMSLHVPGDVPDLQSIYLEVMDHSVGALAPSKVAFIPHAALRELIRREPGIAEALWCDTMIDASIYREWVSNVGRRSSLERAAHLMCELFVKFDAVGLADPDGCPFPLTQGELADALGISIVHVNRTLQALRADSLIVLKGSYLRIPNFDALAAAGGFDPTYLHLDRPEAA